ncbi:MBL fold metallo-hydrolase [Paenibacillus psychroresistens]|nr:MBL fold metallo-hydrolase [Paenibacillus psychroresistens]
MEINNGIETPTIIQVKIPLPFPLRWVNSYIIRGQAGLTVIDPGLHTEEAERVWQATLDEYGFQFSDFEQIVLTHHHPDHYGMAGWFQERCGGIPVWISEVGYEQVQRLWGEDQPLTAEIATLFIRHGMDKALVEDQLIPHMMKFVEWVTPAPQVSFIALDQLFRMGDRMYKPFVTPGHAAGHICFYEESSKEIFCGDHVLPQITPNVSYIPGVDENPLLSFLVSLEQINQFEVNRAYPGHREPFNSFNQRVEELIMHHEDRLDKLMILLDQPKHVYQLCVDFFGQNLSIHQMRFAMAETLAHVIYLQEKSRIVESIHEGICYYSILESRL